MQKLLLGSIAIACLISAPATAADMAVKTDRAPTAWTWTGMYVGAAAGAKWANTTWTVTSLRDPPGVVQPDWIGLPSDTSSPRNYDTVGARVGVYLGYNWQFSPRWVGGLEFDFGYFDRTSAAIGFPGCSIACSANFGIPYSAPAAGGDITSVRMLWDAGLRARLGYLAKPDLLVFATGGVAWQRIEASGICGDWHTSNYCFGPGPLFQQPDPSIVTNKTTRAGWTFGGGLEWRIVGNWLARGEYRYANFGAWSPVFPFGPSINPFTNETGDDNTYRFRLKAETHIATVGLAYKFD